MEKASEKDQSGAQQLLNWKKEPDSKVDGLEFASYADRLQFDVNEGMIWFGSERLLLLYAEWFLELRKELIAILGHRQTRGLLTRLGYVAGSRGAKSGLKEVGQQTSWQRWLFSGEQFHALKGMSRPVILAASVDLKKRHCYIELLLRNSVEGSEGSCLPTGGADGVCWMEAGYLSGALTTILGIPVVVHETECRGHGHSSCRMIARFADEWGNIPADLQYLAPASLPEPQPTITSDPSSQNTRSRAIQDVRPSGTSSSFVIGRSAPFNAVLHQIHRVADTAATVLLLGESGVGKSAFAREVHLNSPRANAPFIEVNCAAIPEMLIESELFGVEKGAFTGAEHARRGRFEEADGGTLFLDEIGILSFSAQGKLLRVLQSQEFERLGSNKTQRANVRLIAATNEDLELATKEKRFRLDLFYRLNVFPIHVPPLRERKEDLPALIDYFIGMYASRHCRTISGITPNAYRALLNHDWPGNIRELENVIERAVILCPRGEPLDVPHLFASNYRSPEGRGLHWLSDIGKLTSTETELEAEPDPGANKWIEAALQNDDTLFDLERKLILAAIKEADNNVAKAAKRLGVSRGQLDYRLKKWQENAS